MHGLWPVILIWIGLSAGVLLALELRWRLWGRAESNGGDSA